MNMAKAEMPYQIALDNGRRIMRALESSCHSIMIVGSVRRMKPTCGDVEILCVPKRSTDLFGVENGRAHTDVPLQSLVDSGSLSQPTKNGERQKQFTIQPLGLQLDLWLVPQDEWPVQLAIRTGPADYSRAIVTERHRGGLLLDGHCIHHGKVWRKCERTGEPKTMMPVDSESDFLDRFCGGYVYPGKRRPPAKAF